MIVACLIGSVSKFNVILVANINKLGPKASSIIILLIYLLIHAVNIILVEICPRLQSTQLHFFFLYDKY